MALITVGALLLVIGAALIFIPAGVMVAGVICMSFGINSAGDITPKPIRREAEL